MDACGMKLGGTGTELKLLPDPDPAVVGTGQLTFGSCSSERPPQGSQHH